MSAFLNALYTESSKTLTENGAVTFDRTGSLCLDFFAQGGALRANPKQAVELFKQAFAEDAQSAIRILFYLRDVRGGQGEREMFRQCLTWLDNARPDCLEQVVHLVAEYGRWDDLVHLDSKSVWELVRTRLQIDDLSEKPSLLAKWLPTINTHNEATKLKARKVCKALGMNPITYRKIVRDIRAKIKLVEQKMSANQWGDINYPTVPSQAGKIYRKAFSKHDGTRYAAYLGAVEKGEAKINAGTLYPYQIYKSVQESCGVDATLEALWSALPDYTQGKNALVVADVSGSMSGDPLAVSVSLALYFAERNKGLFQDHFITFSERPVLKKIVGKTLTDKMAWILSSEWGMNTNLTEVFSLILGTAVKNSLKQTDMPETLYIISDMQFDSACSTKTNFEVIQKKYEAAGYTVPTLVFWNVRASERGGNLPVQQHQKNVSLVSGFSPSAFKLAVENKTPMETMIETINSERYAQIVIK